MARWKNNNYLKFVKYTTNESTRNIDVHLPNTEDVASSLQCKY